MVRRVAYLTVVSLLGALLGGCALNLFDFDKRAAWREVEERACQARRPPSTFVAQIRPIDGKGACGIDYPLKVSALESGTIGIGPTATIGCPMTEALDTWMRDSVQPAALAWFGQPVIEIRQISAYSCRTRNNRRGAELSEHAFGNALDVAGFKLADGRTIVIKSHWKGGSAEEKSFLREVFAGACQTFKTVLGPGSDMFHYDHIHVDLAHHNRAGTSRYCKPTPTAVPQREPYDGARMAAIPGQPRYGVVPAYTASIEAADPIAELFAEGEGAE